MARSVGILGLGFCTSIVADVDGPAGHQITAEVSMNIFETVNNARTYTGCVMGNCYPQEFIPMLIEAWKEGKFPFDEVIKRYAATDMQTAVRDTMSGEVIKAVLKWS